MLCLCDPFLEDYRGETFHLAKITMGIQPSNGTNDLQRDTRPT